MVNALFDDGTRGAIAIDEQGTVTGRLLHGDDVAAAERAGCEVVDVGGRLVLPALAEPHAHLDKALTADVAPNPTGDLRGAIDAWISAEQSGAFDHDSMVARVDRSLAMLLTAGTTLVRSHINVGGRIGVSYLVAAQQAAARFRDAMDIEFVALTHMPMSGPGSETNLGALNEAIDIGVDSIGGCPHLEPDAGACIDLVLDLAEQHGRSVDLHIDETLDPTVLTLETLALRCSDRAPRVSASHCVSLGMVTSEIRDRVIDRVRQSDVSVVALPQTNLFLQGRERPVATPRGLTPVLALKRAGVTVAAGADNAQDPFNLVGRSDPLETAALMVMAGHLLPQEAYDMVSLDVRTLMGRGAAGTQSGDVADLIAVPSGSVRETIAEAPADRMVFRGGRLVARSTLERRLYIG